MNNRPTLDTLGDDNYVFIENRHHFEAMIFDVIKGKFFPKNAHLAMGAPFFHKSIFVDLEEWIRRAELKLSDNNCSKDEADKFLNICRELLYSSCDLWYLGHANDELSEFVKKIESVELAILCSEIKQRVMYYRLQEGDGYALLEFLSTSFSRISTYEDLLVLSYQHRAIDAFVCTGLLHNRGPVVLMNFQALLNNIDYGIENILEDAYDLYKRLDPRASEDDDDTRRGVPPGIATTRDNENEEKKTLAAMIAESKEKARNQEQRRSRKAGGDISSKGGNRDITREFEGILNSELQIVQAGDLEPKFDALCRKFPHARDAIDAIFADLAVADGDVRFRHTLLVGSPGCGKTQLAREIGKVFGLHTTVYSCTGVTDGMFAGTPRGWASANPSIPVHSLKAGKMMNPLIILDELEKAGQERRNGNLIETLLTFLERKQAQAVFDKALTAEIDLSYVNYIGTANDTMSIKGPLLDRMRVVHVPEPKLEHLGDLARSIIDGIAEEKGWQPGMIEPLDELEKAVIRKVWKGGSIRRLSVAITRLVEARDKIAQVH